MSAPEDDPVGRARLALMIDHLAAGLAHEFNNVLTPIVVGLARPDGSLEAADLRRAVERGTRLTSGLQMFPAQGASVGPLSLDRFVADFAPALRRLVTNEIVVSAQPSGEPTHVHVGAWVLEQVLWRVAQRASEEAGQLSITLSTEHHDASAGEPALRAACPLLARGGRCQAIRVQSQPRAGAPPSPSRGVAGGGLLALAQVLAARVGGVVSPADHWPEDGAVVVHLPIAGSEKEADVVDPCPAHADVIVVEDDDDLRSLMRRLLQREGHVVAEAHSAEDALTQLPGHHAARLLLTDLSLGGSMNGVELLRRATDTRPDLRVLLVSGHAATVAPTLPFLRKPFTPRMFVAKVRELLPPPERPAGPTNDAGDLPPPPDAPGDVTDATRPRGI